MSKRYGCCAALSGHPIQGTDEVLVSNPNCRCWHPMAAMTCPFGHMLECHFPMTCEEAQCEHFTTEHEHENEPYENGP